MGVKLNLKEFLLPLRQCTARPQGSSDCDGYMEFSSSAFAAGQEQSAQT
jgi:hypothetical protein